MAEGGGQVLACVCLNFEVVMMGASDEHLLSQAYSDTDTAAAGCWDCFFPFFACFALFGLPF